MKQVKSIAINSFYNKRKIIFFTALLVTLLYGNTLRNGYSMDDEMVTINHSLTSKGIAAIPEILTSPYYKDEMGYSFEYRPVTLISFAIEHQFFGDKPGTSHFFNLLFYFFCCLAFIVVLKLLFPGKDWLVIISGLIFITHPLHTEAVASIKNRDEILSLLFALLALYQAIKYIHTNNQWRVLFSTCLLMAGLFSKSSSASFLFIIPLSAVFISDVDYKKIIVLVSSSALVLLTFLLVKQYTLLWLVYFVILLSIVISVIYLSRNKTTSKHIWEYIKRFGSPKGSYLIKVSISEINIVDIILYSISGIIITISYVLNNYMLVFLFSAILVWVQFWQKNYRLDLLILLAIIVSLTNFFSRTAYSILPMFMFIFLIVEQVKTDWKKKYIPLAIVCVTYVVKSFSVEWDTINLIAIIFPLLMSRFTKWKYAGVSSWLFVLFLQIIDMLKEPQIWTNDIYYLIVYGSCALVSILPARLLLKAGMGLLVTIFLFGDMYQERTGHDILFSWHNTATEMQKKVTEEKEIESMKKEEKSNKLQTGFIQRESRPLNFVEFPLGFSPTFSQKYGTVSYVLGYYLKMMFYPIPMSFYYGFSEIKVVQLSDVRAIASIIVHLLILFSAIFFINSHPCYSFGVIIYLSSIFLFSNLVSPVAGMVGDRLTFVASAGFSMAVGYSLFITIQKTSAQYRKVIIIVFSIIMVVFSGRVMARNSNWKDSLTLYRHDLKQFSNSAQGHNLLATRLVFESGKSKTPMEQEGLRREALVHYKKALEIYPEFFNAQYDLARTYGLLSEGENAIREYKKVIALDSLFSFPYAQIGLIYQSMDQPQKSAEYFEKLLKLTPEEIQVYGNLSAAYASMGNFEKVMEINMLAAERFPESYDPILTIGKIYLKDGNKRKALEYFEKANQLNPNDKNLIMSIASLYHELGETEKAEYYYRKANPINKQ